MIKREYDDYHLIDGCPMLVPDVDVEITYTDIEADGSGYDEAGYYHRLVARYNVRTWKFKYAILTKEEFVYLRSLYKDKNDFKFTLLNENDVSETVTARCKPISVAYQSKRSGLFKNLNLEIIEA
jgi:hypothetical protein